MCEAELCAVVHDAQIPYVIGWLGKMSCWNAMIYPGTGFCEKKVILRIRVFCPNRLDLKRRAATICGGVMINGTSSLRTTMCYSLFQEICWRGKVGATPMPLTSVPPFAPLSQKDVVLSPLTSMLAHCCTPLILTTDLLQWWLYLAGVTAAFILCTLKSWPMLLALQNKMSVLSVNLRALYQLDQGL